MPTNRISVLSFNNQSEIDINLCQPIRDRYLHISTNQRQVIPETRRLCICFIWAPRVMVKLSCSALISCWDDMEKLESDLGNDPTGILFVVLYSSWTVITQDLNSLNCSWWRLAISLSYLSTNQRSVRYCVNQSEISKMLCQPIRDQYYRVSTN